MLFKPICISWLGIVYLSASRLKCSLYGIWCQVNPIFFIKLVPSQKKCKIISLSLRFSNFKRIWLWKCHESRLANPLKLQTQFFSSGKFSSITSLYLLFLFICLIISCNGYCYILTCPSPKSFIFSFSILIFLCFSSGVWEISSSDCLLFPFIFYFFFDFFISKN